MRLMVYSHDTFGLGNIRRMLAICTHLRASIPDLSILIVSGSPMLQSFRVMHGIDYIKLPCLKRAESGDLGVRFLDLDADEIVRLRSELILSSVMSYRPDVVLVDKKPEGLAGEMEPSLRYLKSNLADTRLMLVLRDILDTPATTIPEWSSRGCYNTIRWFYDDVLVLGTRDIFDACAEYGFPESVCNKVTFCGYIAREAPRRSRQDVRAELNVADNEDLVLVTTGGGEDGFPVLSTALEGVSRLCSGRRTKCVIVQGPELPASRATQVRTASQHSVNFRVMDFVDDMMAYMNAADVVVSMAGYNTVCELLSLCKPAVLIPRVMPVQEQKIRAQRMSHVPFLRTVLPENLSPTSLATAITAQLRAARSGLQEINPVDMRGLECITDMLTCGAGPISAGAILAGSRSVLEGVSQ